ncbi:S9 family peptidase [Paludibacterium paludis]|uniref:Peptidase S9 family protein n=1 Tax=Paludibacterium paludis TaxID=1225769 RepID=A0A918P613_9NEIS|nr:prolyl oligopeptidase family serine peptidase [Paludibacterium paludis]GGY24066.1 peptidase S9 family protein [Paludibacterium paludis]
MKQRILAILVLAQCGAAMAAGYSGLGVASISKETLEQFRPKALDPALSGKIQRYLDLRSPGSGALSPDGKSLFFTWRVTGVNQIWRIDGPQGFPVQMTGGTDTAALDAITPDGKWLVISRDRNGEENPGLYLQPASGGELNVIQHKNGIRTLFEFLSDDGRYVYYRSNDEQPDRYTLYRYELAGARTERLFSEPGSWEVMDHRPDGKLLLANALSNSNNEIFEYDPAGKTLTPLFGQGEGVDYTALYGPAGELIVRTDKFGEFHRLYRWTAGVFTPITPDIKWNVSAFTLDTPRQKLYYEVNEGGYTRSYALDARTGKPLGLPAFKEADSVTVGSGTRDGRYRVLMVSRTTAPPTSFVFDWKTGKTVQWVLPSSPEIATGGFARATLESYPARDGARIPMFVRRPARCSPAPCPVLVYFHGGPESQSRPGFSAYAQMFVDAGFIFVEPNVRGSAGYGKTWLHSDDGAKRLDVVTDIEDAARHIRANWGANGKAPRVGVLGGSYGGYSTMLAMTMFAGAYDAGVSNVGMANLVTFLQNTAPYRRANRMAEYGDLQKNREALVKLSPVTYTDRLKAPLMIIQGASDPRVPVGEAVQMYEAARSRGVRSELILFADEGHGTQKRDNRVLEIGHTLRFFETWLKER